MKTHEHYMSLALELAAEGLGHTNPNPMVGAVLVKEGSIIGTGFHTAYGKDHAEIEALKEARKNGHDPNGSVLYVNLEPCCHRGKTPPCTQALIENGIKMVFVAQKDPNPLVSGMGIKCLEEVGIAVHLGILEEEALWLNRVFNHYIHSRIPYVRLKTAMSLDGKIATATGNSKWITGEEAREEGRKLRAYSMAVMTGRGTLEADNPMLTARTAGYKEPIRIILDRQLSAPLDYQIFSSESLRNGPVWVVCEEGVNLEKQEKYNLIGVKCINVSSPLNLKILMDTIGSFGIDSILIEAGSKLSGQAINEGIIHELCTFIGPKLIGGKEAKGLLGDEGALSLDLATELEFKEITNLGKDLFIRSAVIKKQNAK